MWHSGKHPQQGNVLLQREGLWQAGEASLCRAPRHTLCHHGCHRVCGPSASLRGRRHRQGARTAKLTSHAHAPCAPARKVPLHDRVLCLGCPRRNTLSPLRHGHAHRGALRKRPLERDGHAGHVHHQLHGPRHRGHILVGRAGPGDGRCARLRTHGKHECAAIGIDCLDRVVRRCERHRSGRVLRAPAREALGGDQDQIVRTWRRHGREGLACIHRRCGKPGRGQADQRGELA